MVNDADCILFALSVTEQFTVVVPNGKVEPDDGEQVGGVVIPAGEDAVTTKSTIAPDGPVASTVMSDGTVRTRPDDVNVTVIVNDAEPMLPA